MGRVFEKVILIPTTIPGETVRAEIIQDKKDYYVGKLIELVKPVRERVDPPCKYFPYCGGCDYQHIPYHLQLKLKEEILADILKRVGGIKNIEMETIIPSPNEFDYRLRTRLRVCRSKGKTIGGRFGFFERNSHKFLDIDECKITHPAINRLILVLVENMDSNFYEFFEFANIILSNTTGKIIVILEGKKLNKSYAEEIFQDIKMRFKPLVGLCTRDKKCSTWAGNDSYKEVISTTKYSVNSDSFFQINHFLHEILQKKVINACKPKQRETFLDLYCGVGTFSVPLAAKSQHVVGIEENIISIEDANYNMRLNKIKNCVFIKSTAEKGLAKVIKNKMSIDSILLNPPRRGCSDVVKKEILSISPKKIIYLSCNPATLSRDLRFFLKYNYILKMVHPIDLFPQTHHIETIIKLEKTTS